MSMVIKYIDFYVDSCRIEFFMSFLNTLKEKSNLDGRTDKIGKVILYV